MTFTDVQQLNRNPKFRDSRLDGQKNLLVLLTLGGALLVGLWQLFDGALGATYDYRLLWLRMSAIVFFGLNYLAIRVRQSARALKQHIILGFYITSLFFTLVAVFTGAGESPYWFGLFFILNGWFLLAPYSLTELLVHACLFLTLYLTGLYVATPAEVIPLVVARNLFLYSGTMLFGAFAGYIRNKADAENFKVKGQLEEQNETLRKTIDNLHKFQLVLNQAPGAVFIVDKHSNLEYLNPYFTKLSGYTEADVLHKSIIDVFYKGKVPESRQNLIARLLAGNSWQGELEAWHKNGGSYWVNMIAAPFKDEAGEIDGFCVIQQDITSRKRMELALAESENLYRSLIESSLDAVVLSQNGKILLVNKAFCTTFGYSHDEALSIGPTTIIAPEDQERVVEIHNKRMRGEIDTLQYTAHFLHKLGHRLFVEINSTTVIINGQNASFISMRDSTHQQQMQLALAQSEAKYRELVESANSIILKWDKEFKVLFLNEYGLHFFGYSRDEIFGRPAVGTIIPYSEELTGRNLERLMAEIFENPEKYEQNINENERKNGERVWIAWNNKAIRNEQGEVVSMFSVGTDITERRKYEEELRITKEKLQELNTNLEVQVNETVEKLTEANTQLIRLQKENLQSQFEVLRQQVNPHFLFNSLNVLTSLIKIEPDLAEKFTEHLSKVYRYVLENKDNDLVSLQTELDFLDAYIFLLHIRFTDKIKIHIDIAPDIREMLILPIALQLLIENAIKHNTMSKRMPLEIHIEVENRQWLRISNNLQERESHMASTGVGLKNIAHRYELLEMPSPEFYKTDCCFVARVPLKNTNDKISLS